MRGSGKITTRSARSAGFARSVNKCDVTARARCGAYRCYLQLSVGREGGATNVRLDTTWSRDRYQQPAVNFGKNFFARQTV